MMLDAGQVRQNQGSQGRRDAMQDASGPFCCPTIDVHPAEAYVCGFPVMADCIDKSRLLELAKQQCPASVMSSMCRIEYSCSGRSSSCSACFSTAETES